MKKATISEAPMIGLFGSRAAYQVLMYLENYGQGYAAEIARTFGMSLSQVQNQLRKFEELGILTSRMEGAARFFYFVRSPIVDGLRIFLRSILERLGVGEASSRETKAKTMTEPAGQQDDFIEFDDLMKIDLRVGLVEEAERVEKSKKLLKLVIDAGEAQPRQILAGISEHYAPEDLIGKRVVIVANLKPRKLMGLESQGMVLAASDDEGLGVLLVDGEVTPGSRAK